MRLNDDERTVAGDGRARPGIGEIVGGSQRESASTCSMPEFARWGSIPRCIGGIAICAGTAPCRTPASGWGLIGRGLRHGDGKHQGRHPLPAHARQR